MRMIKREIEISGKRCPSVSLPRFPACTEQSSNRIFSRLCPNWKNPIRVRWKMVRNYRLGI